MRPMQWINLLRLAADPKVTRVPVRVLAALRRAGKRRLPEKVDREVAAGELTVESSKVSTTRSWRMQRTAFTTLIYKNTTAPDSPAGEGTTNE